MKKNESLKIKLERKEDLLNQEREDLVKLMALKEVEKAGENVLESDIKKAKELLTKLGYTFNLD